MTKPEDKPTPPVSDDRSPARDKDQKSTLKPADDLPGADGESSAGANEDTYD